MTKRRMLIAVLAVLGAVFGAAIGVFVVAAPNRYSASADVAFLPAPNLTTVEASNFWEVLTRGQVTRTAAILYDDPRWLSTAADAAKVPRDDLTLQAMALPDTTMLTVTVSASSAGAAEAALNNVLTTATPEVSSLVAPYFVKVLWPPENSASTEAAPGWMQLAAGGAFGGFLIGAGIGWLVQQRRGDAESGGKHSGDVSHDNSAVDGSARGTPPGS